MDKKKMFIVFILLSTFLFIGNVNAEEDDDENYNKIIKGACTLTEESDLRRMAANVRVTYVPGEMPTTVSPDGELGITTVNVNYLDVKVFNMNSKMSLEVAISGDGVNSTNKTVDYRSINSDDGSITFRQNASNSNIDYLFEIYAYNGNCAGKLLRTIRLTVPKFNFYSELEVCKDIPDYYLCLQYTTYKVDGATFYDKVAEYKEKLAASQLGQENNTGNTGIVSQTVSTVSKYKYVIVGVIVAVGVVVTVLIIKGKKSVL